MKDNNDNFFSEKAEQTELSLNIKKNNVTETTPDPEPKWTESGSQLSFFNDEEEVKTVTKRQKVFKVAFTVFFVLFVVAVLVYTAYDDFSKDTLLSFGQIMQYFAVNWYYFLFAFIAFLLTYLFEGLKTSFMMKASSGKYRFWICMESAIYHRYYDFITPLGTGGQAFVMMRMRKRGVDVGSAVALPLVSFIIYQVTFSILVVAALILNAFDVFGTQAIVTPAVYLLAILGIVLGMIFPTLILLFSYMPKMGNGIVKFVVGLGAKLKLVKDRDATLNNAIASVKKNSDAVKLISKDKWRYLPAFLCGFLQHAALCSIAYFTLRGFGYDDITHNGMYEWVQLFLIAMLLYAAVSFIPTPGNSGAADFSFYAIFNSFLAAWLG